MTVRLERNSFTAFPARKCLNYKFSHVSVVRCMPNLSPLILAAAIALAIVLTS